jgi:hypothetical protein
MTTCIRLLHQTSVPIAHAILDEGFRISRHMIAADRCANFTEEPHSQNLNENTGCILEFNWVGPVENAMLDELTDMNSDTLYRYGAWRSVLIPPTRTHLTFSRVMPGCEHAFPRSLLDRVLRRDEKVVADRFFGARAGTVVPVLWTE